MSKQEKFAQNPVEAQNAAVETDRDVAEVMASYNGTVLDVAHVGQVKSRRKSAGILLGVGGALFIGGAALFATEVKQDWDTYHQASLDAREQGLAAPAKPGWGTGALGFGIALLGLVPFVSGLGRRRDDAKGEYTIGEAHGAAFHTPMGDLPVTAPFPLVRRNAKGYELSFTKGMSGEVSIFGQRESLEDLVRLGRVRTQADAYSVDLPRGAKARVQHEGLTFHVHTVAAGAAVAGRGTVEWPVLGFVGGTAVTAMGFWFLMRSMPDVALAFELDNEAHDNRFVGFMSQPDEEPEVIEDVVAVDSEEPAGGDGQRAAGPEGKMGDSRSKAKDKHYSMKGPANAAKQMARNFDPDMQAREAGILGIMQQEQGHFLASNAGKAFAIGNDAEDVWGNLTGTEIGTANGVVGGLGLVGDGHGGGGMGEGTIGLGQTGLIGGGGGGGTGHRYGPGNGVGFGKKTKKGPKVRVAKAKVTGALDKDIIRRVVRGHINEVRSCYNKGLAKNPSLQGRVAVNFVITSTGKVGSAVVQESSLKGDTSVGNCIKKAVKRWKFPKPRGGGNVIVTYPFNLTTA